MQLAYILRCFRMLLNICTVFISYAELSMLKDVKASLGLGIGVIDIKDNKIETPEDVAHRIEHAARLLGSHRIQYVHPDCGFWMLPRSVADEKMKALVAGRNLFEGRSQDTPA